MEGQALRTLRTGGRPAASAEGSALPGGRGEDVSSLLFSQHQKHVSPLHAERCFLLPLINPQNPMGQAVGTGGACGAAGRGSPDDLRPQQPSHPCAPSIQPVGQGSQQSQTRMFLQELAAEPEEGSRLSSPGLAIQTKGHPFTWVWTNWLGGFFVTQGPRRKKASARGL